MKSTSKRKTAPTLVSELLPACRQLAATTPATAPNDRALIACYRRALTRSPKRQKRLRRP